MTSKAIVIVVAAALAVPLGFTLAGTRPPGPAPVALFGGKLKMVLPKTAGTPRRINSRTYQVRPNSPTKKFVIFAIREKLYKDEIGKNNRQLAASVRKLLEAQGYEVIGLQNDGTVFTADFRSYATVPWQKVGTSPTRGTARFVRTSSNELIGSVLLCDPRQWKDPAIAEFKKTIAQTKVTK